MLTLGLTTYWIGCMCVQAIRIYDAKNNYTNSGDRLIRTLPLTLSLPFAGVITPLFLLRHAISKFNSAQKVISINDEGLLLFECSATVFAAAPIFYAGIGAVLAYDKIASFFQSNNK